MYCNSILFNFHNEAFLELVLYKINVYCNCFFHDEDIYIDLVLFDIHKETHTIDHIMIIRSHRLLTEHVPRAM